VDMEAEKTNGGAGTAYDETMAKLPLAVIDIIAAKTIKDRAAYQ
jgi:hypothetical protein